MYSLYSKLLDIKVYTTSACQDICVRVALRKLAICNAVSNEAKCGGRHKFELIPLYYIHSCPVFFDEGYKML